MRLRGQQFSLGYWCAVPVAANVAWTFSFMQRWSEQMFRETHFFLTPHLQIFVIFKLAVFIPNLKWVRFRQNMRQNSSGPVKTFMCKIFK